MSVKLKDLQQHIQKSVSLERVKLHQNLATILFDSSTVKFLDSLGVAQFANLTAGALEFLDNSPLTKPRIRIYNPSNEENGWQTEHTAIEICLKDRPFIIDSIRLLLKKEKISLHHLLHPILSVDRTSEGQLSSIYLTHSDTLQTESYELFLVDSLEESQKETLTRRIYATLENVVAATDDYQDLRARCREVRAHFTEIRPYARSRTVPEPIESLDEYIEFFDWLDEDNFVFLGYREYAFTEWNSTPSIRVNEGSGLGILRDGSKSRYSEPVPIADLPPDQLDRISGPPLVLINKTNSESVVHRPARMDYISVKGLDENGEFLVERRFVGLFTSKTFTSATNHIPILRRKQRQVLELERVRSGSHDFKQIISIFNSIPRGELFWLDVENLHRDIQGIRNIEQEQGVRVLRRFDPLHRGIAVIVIMPRERFDSAVRQKIQDFLADKLQATHVDYQTAMVGEDDYQVRLHFFFSTTLSYDETDFTSLDHEVAELTRSWEDRLQQVIEDSIGEKHRSESDKVIQIFPEGYRAEIPASEAVRDIHNLLKMGETPYRIDLHNPDSMRFPEMTSYLRIYHRGSLTLNRVFPVLENLGFRIIEQISYPCAQSKSFPDSLAIDIFRVQDNNGDQIDIERDGPRLEEALFSVLIGDAKNDRINQLVLNSGLEIRQAGLLRTYRSYLSQISAATSLTFITNTLIGNPVCTALLFDFFDSKFNPLSSSERSSRIEKAKTSFLECLDSVSTLPEDEILRFIYRIIDSTVRTNYYLNKPYISIKIESQKLENIPEPRPYFEVFVESSKLEGIHLRGGEVARGGIRWSDRPDDFRTEILGLMKTQMTKNTLIVPVGSKGGFVLKGQPSNPSALKEYVREQYRTFIRGLLDLTDNIVDSRIVHPPGLVFYDKPDPYLVVAADKGTATFSDTANQISKDYGFWLGDAFASGGSFGYDHKKEGITAKGTWECVKRHFWELGIDPFKEDFTVIGIGDMSGDVFGNGMLYTDKIRLLAAFNHRHIFVDPNPIAQSSFQERKRLFENPALSWADYNPDLISRGGGVFPRQAKSNRLSPEIKQLFGIEQDEISSQEMVRRILQLDATLLWNGGVGTYVKASSERNADVGDSNNNRVRIDATQLKAKVIGEGGNLGMTQLARIEYAEAGGKINTDAVDNSGGVDMSDHEVNIKILLQNEVGRDKLDLDGRNSLLRVMTDEVSSLVLRNNYCQTMSLSIAEMASRKPGSPHSSLQDYLVKETQLKPGVEFLPSRSIRNQRVKNKKGYTRPELSILLAYTKMGIKQALLDSTIPDEEVLQKYLHEYFPKVLQTRFAQSIQKHPLRREIVATQLTNLLVDQLGMDFVHSCILETGAKQVEVIRSILATFEILNLGNIYSELFVLDRKVRPEDFYDAVSRIIESCRGIVQWILFTGADTENLTAYVSAYRSSLAELQNNLETVLPASSERKAFVNLRKKASNQGFSRVLSRELASAGYLPGCMGVIDVSQATNVPLDIAAKSYYQLGDKLDLGWLRDELEKIDSPDRWESVAISSLVMDLRHVQRQLTLFYLNHRKTAKEKSIQSFLNQQSRLVARVEYTLQMMHDRQRLDLASGVVVSRLLLQLLRSLEIEN